MALPGSNPEFVGDPSLQLVPAVPPYPFARRHSLDPAIEFWWNIPPDIDQSIRTLVAGQLELLAEPSLQPIDRAVILGQALAWTVREAQEFLTDPFRSEPPIDFEDLREVNRWVQEVMLRSHQDGIFRHVLAFYDASLDLNSREEIDAVIQDFHPDLKKRLQPSSLFLIHPETPEHLLDTGVLLGKLLEGTTSSLLIYGRAKGMYQDEDLKSQGVDLEALEKFRRFVFKTQNLDLTQANGKEMRAYLDMHEEVLDLVRRIRGRWGESHPLVRGFHDGYFRGELEEDQLLFLNEMAETTRKFLYGIRH